MKDWYELRALGRRAELWIYEQIGEDWFGEGLSAKELVQELSGLEVDEIVVHLNSPGGSVFDGQAIYNALRTHSARVISSIEGVAASIASVVAMAGDQVVMAENALMMIHDPYGTVVGTADDMRHTADVLDKAAGTIRGIYVRRTGLDDETIAGFMRAETWFTAGQALEIGLADEVGQPVRLAASAAPDLRALGYRRAPAELLAALYTEDTDPEAAEAPVEAAAEAATHEAAEAIPKEEPRCDETFVPGVGFRKVRR